MLGEPRSVTNKVGKVLVSASEKTPRTQKNQLYTTIVSHIVSVCKLFLALVISLSKVF